MTTTAKAILAWSAEIEKRSGGRVKFTPYFSWALIPSREQSEIPRAVSHGVADIHNFVGDVNLLPLNSRLLTLPFLGWPSLNASAEIIAELFDKFPELQAEFDALGVKHYTFIPSGPQHIFTMKSEVRHPDGLRGKRYLADGINAELISLLGGTPIQVGAGDFYTSLERGLADGIFNATGACVAFGLIPLWDYFHWFGDGGVSVMLQGLIINPGFWNKLPADIQQIFNDTLPELNAALIQAQHESNKIGRGIAQREKQTMVVLTDEELAVWAEKSAPLRERTVQGLVDKGMPVARDIYKELVRLIETHK